MTILLVTTLVFAAAGAAYALKAPRTYVAHATALIRPVVGNAFSSDTTTNPQNTTVALQTEAQLVNSAAVGHLVNAELGRFVCAATSVSSAVLVNSQLLQVSYTAKSPQRAQRCANAFVTQYLNYRQTLAQQTRASALTRLTTDAQNTSRLLAAAQNGAKGAHPSTEAIANVRLYSTRLAAIESQLGTVGGESTEPGSVVVAAVLPSAPSGLKGAVYVVAAIVVGLVVGSLLALWRERRKHRRRSEHPTEIDGIPVLATLRGRSEGAVAMPIPRDDTDTDFSLASLAVLANIGNRRVIAVAPAAKLGSVAAVSFRLAREVANAGYSVVLVDAATDSPSVADAVELDPQPGLGELMAGADLADIPLADVSGVQILSNGVAQPSSQDTGSPLKRLRDLVNDLCATADFVIINASSLSSPSGLRQLLWSDAAILAVSDAKSMASEVRQLAQRTEYMKVDLFGVIAVHRARHADVGAQASARSEGWVPDADTDADADAEDRHKGGAAELPDPAGKPSKGRDTRPQERSQTREARSATAVSVQSKRPGSRNRVE